MFNLPIFCKDLRKCIVKGIKKYLNLDTCVQLCAFNFVQNAKCNGFMVARHNHILDPTNSYLWNGVHDTSINILNISHFININLQTWKLIDNLRSDSSKNIYTYLNFSLFYILTLYSFFVCIRIYIARQEHIGNIRSNYDDQLCNS